LEGEPLAVLHLVDSHFLGAETLGFIPAAVEEALYNLLFGSFGFGSFGVDLEGELVDVWSEGGLMGVEFSEGVYFLY
jgi:hypothetical protein